MFHRPLMCLRYVYEHSMLAPGILDPTIFLYHLMQTKDQVITFVSVLGNGQNL